jgi:isoleucyl-tRNA synthetase
MAVSFPQIEQDIIKFWQENDIFKKSLAQNKDNENYIFYDGPPFATGLPHHGHLLASTLKDIVPRYMAMKGYNVTRRFGWDCHGLPIEHEIDKQFNKPTADVVEELGVAKYNAACRDIVMRYSKEWRKTIERLGRWVDFDNDYKTMDKSFMESVWWVFKELWKKDLIYRGTKVVPFSTALGTVLSNFEAGSNYQDVQDPSVVVLFKLKSIDSYIAAWTTTPWTLPANLGLCIGSDVEYSQVSIAGQNIIVATARLEHIFKDQEFKVLSTCQGSDLAGKEYEPLFPYFNSLAAEGAFKILAADFVSTTDGTGIVHAAPAFGEDDYNTLKAAGIESVACHIDNEGKFLAEIAPYAGLYIKDADKAILRDLKEQGLVYSHETCVHSYPFCPRSDTPLIYKAIPSWYIRVEALQDRLLAANEQITWVPGHIKGGRFGKWLENARDWAVSRNRVWGTPLPIWYNETTDKHICIGSIAELERYSGQDNIDDLHKDVVDEISFEVPGEKGVYKRITEVLDCWFESGAMPYAQNHYPFEPGAKLEHSFPADFIAEGLDQTRGWFYTLNVISVALYNKPAFKNVIVNGIIAAADGKKMSKRLKNYTAPDELFDSYGADALRLYMINSGLVKGQEQRFRDEGVLEVVRQTLLPFFNAFKFFTTYAKIDNYNRAKHDASSTNIMDLWLVSRCQSLFAKVDKNMMAYKLYEVVPEVLKFIDELTNIYIRLNRQRFWQEGMGADKAAAFATLYDALYSLSLSLAPFAPFIAEHVFQGLCEFNAGKIQESVHLCRYPLSDGAKINAALEVGVLLMQQVLVLARQRRNDAKIKIKIPLRSLKIIHRDDNVLAQIRKLESYILAELNVKNISYTTAETDWVNYDIKPNSPVLGKRLGKKFNHFRGLIAALSMEQISMLENDGKVTLDGEEFSRTDILLFKQVKEGVSAVVGDKIAISLDTALDADLLAEGMAREVVSRVQKTRKDIDLNVDDRINIVLSADAELLGAIEKHQAYITKETLTTDLMVVVNCEDGTEHDIDGNMLKLKIEKVAKV